jgi:hypothetical protein
VPEEEEGGGGGGEEEDNDDDDEDVGHDGVDWIGLALGRDRWQAVVNRIMTLRIV